MGNAVKMAAADAREQIIKLAAESLEANTEDLEIRDGNVYLKGVPEEPLPIHKVLGEHYGPSGTVLGKGFYFPQMKVPGKYFSTHMIFWLLGAHGVEVEVNRQTGEVKVLKVYAAHDVGKAIHPANCIGMIEGGIGFGIGFAFFEDFMFKEGNVLNPSFLSYKVPTAKEMPEVESMLVECVHREGPYGAKGIGEISNVPLPPAIGNAIYDAVGVRIKDLPITPDKVLDALKEKTKKKKDRQAKNRA
jgi:CO/xanthine dehydrogenase Mo-binding subunit